MERPMPRGHGLDLSEQAHRACARQVVHRRHEPVHDGAHGGALGLGQGSRMLS